MIRSVAVVAAVTLLFACKGEEPSTEGAQIVQAQPDTTLTADGWGPLRIGMTREELVAAVGDDANPEAVGGPEPEICDEFRPDLAPAGLIVMIEDGRLSRITLTAGSAIRTARGIGVGDSAAAVRAAYGAEAVGSPHKYLPAPAEYVTVLGAGRSEADLRGIVHEVGVDGVLTHIHAGGPSIRYVEGCL